MSDPWAETVERDGPECRVAPFLPDMGCEGPPAIYSPGRPDDDDPDPGEAVVACEGHLAWLRGHRDEARALGLVGR